MCETQSRSEWVTGIREGYETKEIRVGNCLVRIHSPILDAEERALRERDVEAALGSLNMKGVI